MNFIRRINQYPFLMRNFILNSWELNSNYQLMNIIRFNSTSIQPHFYLDNDIKENNNSIDMKLKLKIINNYSYDERLLWKQTKPNKQNVNLLLEFTKKLKDKSKSDQLLLLESITKVGLLNEVSNYQLKLLFKRCIQEIVTLNYYRNPDQLLFLLKILIKRKYSFDLITINNLAFYLTKKEVRGISIIWVPFLFQLLRRYQIKPNLLTFNYCLIGLLLDRKFKEALYLVERMRSFKVPIIKATLLTLNSISQTLSYRTDIDSQFIELKWWLSSFPVIERTFKSSFKKNKKK